MSEKIGLEKELDLFASLEEPQVVSQAALSRRLSVSAGLVNALLKRVIHKGFVKAKSAPYRRWVYYVTPAGFAEKSRLVARYLEVSLDFFRKARREYDVIFRNLRQQGIRNAVLVGRGELAEIAFLAARQNGVEIIGLLDPEVNENRFLGIEVLRELEGADPAAGLVITASRYPQVAYDHLKLLAPDRIIQAPTLLRITVTSPESAWADIDAETTS